MSSLRKRILIIFSILIGLIIILGLTLDIILSSIISNQLDRQLAKFNSKSDFVLSVKKVKINVFSSTLIFKGISFIPDSITRQKFVRGTFMKKTQTDVSVSDVRIRGYNVFKLLLNREVDVSKIIVKDLSLNISETKHYDNSREKLKKPFSITDSLKFNLIEHLHLGTIVIENFNVNIFNIDRQDTVFQYRGKELDINGIIVEKIPNTDNFFELNANDLSLSMDDQQITFDEQKYELRFKHFKYTRIDSSMMLTDFVYKPQIKKEKLAASYKFDKEVYDIAADKIAIKGFKIYNLIREGCLDINSITLYKLSVNIYKDKNNPPDYNNVKLFPQQALKKMHQDINIGNIYLKDSYLSYSEISPRSDKPVFVDMTNVDANITGVCSIKDSLENGKKLKLDISADLMELAPLNVQIIMPYNSPVDTFYFSGYLGKTNLVLFNKALYPATGIKFKTGILNELQFSVKASPKRSEGEMLMLYEQLEAEVTKSKVDETDKTLSWLANLVLPSSNPSKRGKIKTAKIEFDRITYRGLGNLFWKSVQSGLVNTISPIGKTMEKRKDKRKKKNKKR